MSILIKTRTNDLESQNNKPLDYLPLSEYLKYWNYLEFEPKILLLSVGANHQKRSILIMMASL